MSQNSNYSNLYKLKVLVMISVGCMRFDFQFFPLYDSTFTFDRNMNYSILSAIVKNNHLKFIYITKYYLQMLLTLVLVKKLFAQSKIKKKLKCDK
jgi:hypothetical protein